MSLYQSEFRRRPSVVSDASSSSHRAAGASAPAACKLTACPDNDDERTSAGWRLKEGPRGF